MLCLLSRGISLCLLVFPFRHSRRPIAHKGGIIDFSIQTDAVGDDVNVSVVGVLVRYCYPLAVVKSYSFGKQMAIRISSVLPNTVLYLNS